MASANNRDRGTAYWSMNPDGSAKQRLTDFNNPEHPGFKRKMVIASDASFSPDGSKLVEFLQNGLSYTGALVLIEFDLEKLGQDDPSGTGPGVVAETGGTRRPLDEPKPIISPQTRPSTRNSQSSSSMHC